MPRLTTNILVACSLLAAPLFSNDGSGQAVPAGGIQLRRESRISMDKERLTIAADRVAVEYEFRNTTSKDITTEVVFPLPPQYLQFSPRPLAIEGWHVWVEGKELPYQTQIIATNTKGVDQTALLRRFSIDIESYGHYDQKPDGAITGDADRLSKLQKDELARAGLLDNGNYPTWALNKTYHWRQRFPAHAVLHIKHEYAPSSGLRYLSAGDLQKDQKDLPELNDSCVDPALRKLLIVAAPTNHGFVDAEIDTYWVDYILTTANTWKTPIKDFALVIEKSRPDDYVSFCWDGKVEHPDNRTLLAAVTNFVPKRELRILFFQIRK